MSISTAELWQSKRAIESSSVRDGLFNELSGEEITSAMVGGEDVTAIVDNLIEKAITHGGRDNVSIVVAEVAA